MVLFLAQFCSQLFDGFRGDHSVRTDGEAVAPFLCMLVSSCVCKGNLPLQHQCGGYLGLALGDEHYLGAWPWQPENTHKSDPFCHRCLQNLP